MANYFYTDQNGQKQGPVDDQQLQALATQGTITPKTPLETESGHKGQAGQIPGLTFAASPTFAQPAQVVPAAAGTSGKSRISAALFAVFLGGFGAHKFYLGSWGWGIVFLVFFWTYIPAIIAFVEFIMLLCMTDDAFAKKYSPATKRPFRW